MEDRGMEEDRILGTFPSPEATTSALEALRKAGHQDVTLYSPVDPGKVGIPTPQQNSRVGRFTVAGVFLGLFGGLFLGGGTAILYPIATGGMPILSLPAVGIITFEVMILISLIATFCGFLYFAILAADRKRFIPERVSSDRFGISVRGDHEALASAEKVLKRCGADRVARQIATLWIGISIVLIIPSLVLGWPWSQDMVDQPVRHPQEERAPLNPAIVPRQGRSFESITKEEAPSLKNPVAVTEASLRMGKELFETFCVVCHGLEGKGDGIVADRIGEFPDFTEHAFRDQPGGCFFVAITNGANFVSEISRPRPRPQALSDEESEHEHDEGEAHEHEAPEHQHDVDDTSEHEHEEDPFGMGPSAEHIHEDEDSTDHEHDETASAEHEHEEDPFGMGPSAEHIHDEADSTEHEHDETTSSELEHEEDPFGMGPSAEHIHDEADSTEHEHDEMASADHEHEDEHEHEHAAEEGACGTGHEHGEGEEHKHGSGKKHFMPPYRDALRPVERWHIVNYMKHGLGLN